MRTKLRFTLDEWNELPWRDSYALLRRDEGFVRIHGYGVPTVAYIPSTTMMPVDFYDPIVRVPMRKA